MLNGHGAASGVEKTVSCRDGKGSQSNHEAAVFTVTVLFTTVPATMAALREAAKLAHELRATIEVLAFTVVPYPLDLNRPRVDPLFRLRHFRTMCEERAVDTHIKVRLCRDFRLSIHDSLAPHSLVLIGSRESRWPFSSERRLARSLRHDGHEVILVDDRNKQKVFPLSLCNLKAPSSILGI